MNRFILHVGFIILGICIAVPAVAAPRGEGRAFSDMLLPRVELRSSSPLLADHAPRPNVFRNETHHDEWTVEKIAGRISYAGVIILTADHLFRSVDSILERAQIRCEDGTRVHFASPAGGRMGLMLTVSCPIEF